MDRKKIVSMSQGDQNPGMLIDEEERKTSYAGPNKCESPLIQKNLRKGLDTS